MAGIEIHPEEAAAAAERVAAAADGIASAAATFRAAAEAAAWEMRNASVRNALMDVVDQIIAVPSDVSTRLRTVAEAGSAAVAGMVAVDRNGALTFRAPGSTMVMS